MAKFEHAVVLGGSVAGLLAAVSLSKHFEKVTIVDRDELPLEGDDARKPRRGVPQGTQIHHLLLLGKQKIEALLPGFEQELIDLGCERYDDAADFAQWANGAWRMRVRSGLQIIAFQRPLFEWAIRRRALALPNVTAVKGLAAGLIGVEDGSRVIGAKVKGVEGGELYGDLVVDATGRGSRSPNWVEDLGYQRPEEQHLRIYMGYSTFTARFPDGVLPKGLAGIMVTGSPANPRGGSIRPAGNGLHDVVAYGMLKNYPPDSFDGVMEFFRNLDSPLVADFVKQAEVLSEVAPYQMPGNQRRLWERMSRRPEGFVVVGDAVTSFNPRYGQGMTMAALGATVLGDALERHDSIDGVADEVQQELSPWADLAFSLAFALDSAYPEAEYENLEPPSARDKARSRATTACQTEEAHVLIASKTTALTMDQSYMAAPEVQATITEWVEQDRKPRPEVTDPLDPPAITERDIPAVA